MTIYGEVFKRLVIKKGQKITSFFKCFSKKMTLPVFIELLREFFFGVLDDFA